MKTNRSCCSAFVTAVLVAVLIATTATSQQTEAHQPEPDVWRAFAAIEREVPAPAPGHPCNVFLEGESVVISPPADLPDGVVAWRIRDDNADINANGAFQAEKRAIDAGPLGIGWYRVEYLNEAADRLAWTTAAVLAKLAEPVPQDSPICVDSATAWFARNNPERQERFAELAALAGVNWIRDRMNWGEVETPSGAFAENTTYDTAATLQAKHGLKTLQVFHSTPEWAVDEELDGGDRHRFPRDLKHLYDFCRVMAQRYKGHVLAWEPWNEANITHFGGHTIDEMCALQKAAYFGFKAGDPDVIVCWNVFAGSGSSLHTEGVLLNEAWPYFETYNIHSYGRPDSYLSSFEGPRGAASGRPLWITECGIRLPYEAEDGRGELSPEDEIRQAEFIAQSYASSLHAGVNRHFFFILGNYLERGIQFGLLRRDQTPRPGYVALAAVGRFLAGARCLGRLNAAEDANVYAFRGRPDGVERDVLVAWANDSLPWPAKIAVDPLAVYDYLGRKQGDAVPAGLANAAVFVVLPAGESRKLNLDPLPERASWRAGAPSPVVLQVRMPQEAVRLSKQAYEVEAGKEVEVPLLAYNFGDASAEGRLAVEEAPEGWRISVPDEPVRLDPGETQEAPCRVLIPVRGKEAISGAWIKLRGDFGRQGKPVLAFRLFSAADKIAPAVTKELPAANDAARWENNIVQKASMTRETYEGGVLFTMRFADTDPWGYPRLRLRPEEIPDSSFDGLALTVQVLEGTGSVRVQFVEEGGAAYLTEVAVDADVRTPQRVLALFEETSWGPYSATDEDGTLRPEQIHSVLVGINAARRSTVRLAVRELAWIAY